MYKDTLKLYDDLIAGGCTEAQARAQATQLGAMGNVLDDVRKELHKIDKDLFWMRMIGATMIAGFFANLLFLGWKI